MASQHLGRNRLLWNWSLRDVMELGRLLWEGSIWDKSSSTVCAQEESHVNSHGCPETGGLRAHWSNVACGCEQALPVPGPQSRDRQCGASVPVTSVILAKLSPPIPETASSFHNLWITYFIFSHLIILDHSWLWATLWKENPQLRKGIPF